MTRITLQGRSCKRVLLILLFLLLFYSGLNSNTNTIHRNMVLAIVIAEVVYVFGINRISNPVSNRNGISKHYVGAFG